MNCCLVSQPDAGPGARRAAERSEPQALALKLWTVLARAYASVLAHSQADIARHGLTPGEFAVLEVLSHKGPLLLRDIPRNILVSSGGITFLVASLEKRGLVERRECKEDRRALRGAHPRRRTLHRRGLRGARDGDRARGLRARRR